MININKLMVLAFFCTSLSFASDSLKNRTAMNKFIRSIEQFNKSAKRMEERNKRVEYMFSDEYRSVDDLLPLTLNSKISDPVELDIATKGNINIVAMNEFSKALSLSLLSNFVKCATGAAAITCLGFFGYKNSQSFSFLKK